jgi:hypothetical protein
VIISGLQIIDLKVINIGNGMGKKCSFFIGGIFIITALMTGFATLVTADKNL